MVQKYVILRQVLRTNNNLSPFPEEIIDKSLEEYVIIHFAPTKTQKNLLKENISEEQYISHGKYSVLMLLLES